MFDVKLKGAVEIEKSVDIEVVGLNEVVVQR